MPDWLICPEFFLGIVLNSNIICGSNSTWKSPSSDFEFGFYPVFSSLFLVGIWFGKIPERTLAWYQSPPMEPNSLIQLTSEGQIVVTYPNGSVAQTIDNGDSASSAYMQDNGNFVMKDSHLRVGWESFSSNTFLPGQTLKAGQTLYSEGNGASNYSIGNFLLETQNDGNLELKAFQWSSPAY